MQVACVIFCSRLQLSVTGLANGQLKFQHNSYAIFGVLLAGVYPSIPIDKIAQMGHYFRISFPGDFVTNTTQINSQSDLISM